MKRDLSNDWREHTAPVLSARRAEADDQSPRQCRLAPNARTPAQGPMVVTRHRSVARCTKQSRSHYERSTNNANKALSHVASSAVMFATRNDPRANQQWNRRRYRPRMHRRRSGQLGQTTAISKRRSQNSPLSVLISSCQTAPAHAATASDNKRQCRFHLPSK